MAYDYTTDASCKGAWLFTEGSSGSLADSSGDGNTGTITGAIWDATDVPFGTTGSAPNSLDFNGTSDGVDCGSASTLDNLSTATWMAWINADNVTGSYNFLGKTTPGNYQKQFYVVDGKLGFYFDRSAGNGGMKRESDAVISISTWYHVACAFTSSTSTMKLYKNGVEVSAYTAVENNGASPTDEAAGSFTIGKRNYPTYFNGKMTEVAIFDTALTVSQIAEIYNYGLTGGAGGGSPAVRPRAMLMGVGS